MASVYAFPIPTITYIEYSSHAAKKLFGNLLSDNINFNSKINNTYVSNEVEPEDSLKMEAKGIRKKKNE